MADAIIKCAECGSVSIKVVSWIDALNRPLQFCSMDHKALYLEKLHSAIQEEGKKDEEKEERVLPEMLVTVARKTSRGITIVRGQREVYRRDVAQEGERGRSDFAGEAEPS